MLVNCIFGPTIQGEGKSTGKRVSFLRLAVCNLQCVWCDTPYTWDWKRFNRADEVHQVDNDSIIKQLNDKGVKAVVISGGEPLIQQRELVGLCRRLRQEGYWIEVETNGTIPPSPEFVESIDQFNCSPKLSNSGMSKLSREKREALRTFSASDKTTFKFVVAQEQDIQEILELVNKYSLHNVYLMPEGITKEELLAKDALVRALCEEHGFTFSPRLHIVELGGGRYV